MSKPMKILFAASVVLNVLFAGIVIGTFTHGFKDKMVIRRDMKEAVSGFPEDKRELVRSSMSELRESTRETKRKIREKRREIIQVLKAPEFDPALYDRKVGELHVLMENLGDEFSNTAKRLAVNLDLEERRALADVIMRKRGHRFIKKNWGTDEDPGRGKEPADDQEHAE